MRTGANLVALLALGALASCASVFPVKDADTAIAIGRSVCRHKAAPALIWAAELDVTGRVWDADTMPSVRSGQTTHLWFVPIPVDGPYPTICWNSLYELVDPIQPKPK